MAFPLNPSINDTYVSGTKTYRWDGNAWTRSSISDVASVLSPYALDTDLNTANVTEGSNLYFTNARTYANVIELGYTTNTYVNTRLDTKANTADLTTSNVAEGANLYFTNTRTIGALTSGSGISIAANGLITSSGAVTSVAGQVGAISNAQLACSIITSGVLNTANVAEGSNLYFTNTRSISSLTAGANISIAANGRITALTQGGGVASVYDVDTASTGYFDLPVGTTAQRPGSPANGYIRFNTTTGYGEIYNAGLAQWLRVGQSASIDVEYLVVAGGGGGGAKRGGGGGAGGYRTGTGSGLLTNLGITVTVGAGGSGSSGGSQNATNGGDSVFNNITSTGGGRGAGYVGGSTTAVANSGGSGGGGSRGENTSPLGPGGAGNTPSVSPSQGNNGGTAQNGGGSYYAGAGGGGAGAVGTDNTSSTGGNGGVGVASSISGSSTFYAGGGGGGGMLSGSTFGTGGSGGGGNGSSGGNGSAGTSNTGGGGGGAGDNPSFIGGNGGSGVVILKYLSSYNAVFSGGLTASTAVSGSYKISTVTAGTGTVTFS